MELSGVMSNLDTIYTMPLEEYHALRIAIEACDTQVLRAYTPALVLLVARQIPHHQDVLDKAVKIRQLVAYGYDIKTIANRCGVTVNYVKRVRYGGLIPEATANGIDPRRCAVKPHVAMYQAIKHDVLTGVTPVDLQATYGITKENADRYVAMSRTA